MLQLTRQADYGLRLMLEVGASAGGPVTTIDAAKRQQIPYEFLRKVAHTLVSQGLLASERGARGGLTLRRPAESITMLEIVGAFGAPALNRCTVDPPSCDRRQACVVYPVWAKAQRETERVLASHHLSELVARQAKLSPMPVDVAASDTDDGDGGCPEQPAHDQTP